MASDYIGFSDEITIIKTLGATSAELDINDYVNASDVTTRMLGIFDKEVDNDYVNCLVLLSDEITLVLS
jgi:hypothetical protein